MCVNTQKISFLLEIGKHFCPIKVIINILLVVISTLASNWLQSGLKLIEVVEVFFISPVVCVNNSKLDKICRGMLPVSTVGNHPLGTTGKIDVVYPTL